MLGGFEWCPDILKEMHFHLISNIFLLNIQSGACIGCLH